MRDRMSPEQLARARGRSQQANEIANLAQRANGHGAGRVDAAKAQAELVNRVGAKEAKRQQEYAIRRPTR